MNPHYEVMAVVNYNPYLFGDRIKSYAGKRVWKVKRVNPPCDEPSYWTTYKSARSFLKGINATWVKL